MLTILPAVRRVMLSINKVSSTRRRRVWFGRINSVTNAHCSAFVIPPKQFHRPMSLKGFRVDRSGTPCDVCLEAVYTMPE